LLVLYKTKWEEDRPFKMAVTLVKEDKLIGLSQKEIEAKLGKEIRKVGGNTDDEFFLYFYVEDHWILSVYFKKG
jgi:hypothetical protein